jgi:hypothetical protein
MLTLSRDEEPAAAAGVGEATAAVADGASITFSTTPLLSSALDASVSELEDAVDGESSTAATAGSLTAASATTSETVGAGSSCGASTSTGFVDSTVKMKKHFF